MCLFAVKSILFICVFVELAIVGCTLLKWISHCLFFLDEYQISRFWVKVNSFVAQKCTFPFDLTFFMRIEEYLRKNNNCETYYI